MKHTKPTYGIPPSVSAPLCRPSPVPASPSSPVRSNNAPHVPTPALGRPGRAPKDMLD